MLIRFFLACIIVAISAGALADKVLTRTGRTFTGAITFETPSEVGVKTHQGTIKVKRADVREIVREETTSEEVDGDLAYTANKLDEALEYYRLAVTRVPAQGQARQRLDKRIAAIQQARYASTIQGIRTDLAAAQQLLTAKQYDAAQQKLEGVLPSLPPVDENTSAVRRMLADIHYQKSIAARDRVNELAVEQELLKAIDVYEPHYKAHLAYGEILMRNSATEQQGLEEIRKGVAYAGNELTEDERLRYHYLLGERYFAKENYELAAAHFAECLRVRVKTDLYNKAQSMAAQSYTKIGEQNIMSDFQKTIDNLTEALRIYPENAEAHFLLGRMYKDSGELDKAIQSFTNVTSLNPAHPSVYYHLAEAYRSKQNYDKALENLDLELKQNPTNYDALVDRAEVHIRLLDFDKATNDLNQAIRSDPTKWRAYLLVAQLDYSKEQYPSAQENLMRVLQLKPDAVEAHVLMGKVLQAADKQDDAKKWFQNVVNYLEQIDKTKTLSFKYRSIMAEAQTALGSIDLQQKSPRQAETRFRTALEMVDAFAPALNKIGDVKRDLGNESTDKRTKMGYYKEAEDYYLQATESNPHDANLQLSLGILYHQQLKDTQRAILAYRKYLALGGRDKANVEKWIEECGGPPVTRAVADVTTATVNGAETTGTLVTSSDVSTMASAGVTTATQVPSSTSTATAAVDAVTTASVQ